MKYVVEGSGNLRHNGQSFPAGSVVEMEPDEAKSLVEIGRLKLQESQPEELNHQEDSTPPPAAPAEPVVPPQEPQQPPAPQPQSPPAAPEATATQAPFPQARPFGAVPGQPTPSEVAATAAAVDGRPEVPPQNPPVNLQ